MRQGHTGFFFHWLLRSYIISTIGHIIAGRVINYNIPGSSTGSSGAGGATGGIPGIAGMLMGMQMYMGASPSGIGNGIGIPGPGIPGTAGTSGAVPKNISTRPSCLRWTKTYLGPPELYPTYVNSKRKLLEWIRHTRLLNGFLGGLYRIYQPKFEDIIQLGPTRLIYGILWGLLAFLGDLRDRVLILAAEVRGPREGEGREVKGDEDKPVDHFY